MSKAKKGPAPVDKAQADIRQLMETIRLKTANATVPQPSVAPSVAKEKPVARRPIIYDSPSADPPPIATVRDPRLSNSYARALFFDHTNVSGVVESKMPGRSENSKQKYANTIYETYAVQPSLRIREPLHQISFDTTYHEGLFRMAQTMPLNSAEQFAGYRSKLRSAGIKQLCFVDMTQNNCVLEDQNEIVAKVKSRFNNWSAKLDKLTEYLTRAQQNREKMKSREREMLRKAVLEDSNLQSINSSMLQNLQPKLIDELLHPSEPGMLPIRRHFQFNEDSLNRRYKTGKYFSNRLLPAHVAIFANNGITSSREVSLNSSIVSDFSINQTENVGMDQPSEIASRASLPSTSKNVLVGIEPFQQRSVLSVGSGAPKATSTVDRRLHFQSPARNAQENRPSNEATSHVSTPVVTAVVAAPNPEVDKVCDKPRSYFTLRFVKQNTNVYEMLQTLYQSLKGAKLSDAELETNVVKYYKKFRNLFAVNQLPPGLRLLTAEERATRARQRKSETSTARKETIEQSLETTQSRQQSHENSSVSQPPPPKRHCAQTKPVPSRKRPIVYAEDSLNENELVTTDPTTNPLASQELETPDSINFQPTICSTQNTENPTLHVETVQIPVTAGEHTYANVSQSSIETVPLETSIPIIATIKTESTNVPIKVEPNTQTENNSSGYEEYVQVLSQPQPEVIEIDESCSESIIDYAPAIESTSFRLLTNALFRPPENASGSSQVDKI
ncbi:uncharacterized protein LOC128270656 [Anopheles cruzii]|uniref:uncharacterized protein LOC128270656 n=1 Tax=Anopheles cruzii TaxID=68878 RepID=UPI0022EC3F77|nr:uncharacterized protein LOC128270656 [Anopheles cruzii]